VSRKTQDKVSKVKAAKRKKELSLQG